MPTKSVFTRTVPATVTIVAHAPGEAAGQRMIDEVVEDFRTDERPILTGETGPGGPRIEVRIDAAPHDPDG